MEPHPVPQNILEVEFKLFGSFTLNEFLRIVAGGIGALAIFMIPAIPSLIKYPLMAVLVLIGIALAVIKNFGIWLRGIMKALFISPRYVWVKEEKTPELLKTKQQTAVSKDESVTSMKSKKKIDLSEIPLEKMFVSKAENEPDEIKNSLDRNEVLRGNNIFRMYQDVFGKETMKNPENVKHTRPQTLGGNKETRKNLKVGQNVQMSIPGFSAAETKGSMQRMRQNKDKRQVPRKRTKQEQLKFYEQQIDKLKIDLLRISKEDPDYRQKEEEIMLKINEAHRELKLLRGSTFRKEAVSRQNMETNVNLPGRYIKGIVVDKKDKPLPDIKINFNNHGTNQKITAQTSSSGTFKTDKPLPKGDYSISLQGANKRFHTYRIQISDQVPPAYKFRER